MKVAVSLVAALLTALQPAIAQACMAYTPPALAEELVSFKSCTELDEHVSKLPNPYEYRRRGGFGLGSVRKGRAMEMAKREASTGANKDKMMASQLAAPMADMAMEAEAGAGPADITKTNNQHAAVDEADFVKFNGRHIYQLHENTLRILKAWPANEMNQIATLRIGGHPVEMLMNESSAVVLTNDGSNLKATVVDIRQPQSPRILTEFEVPGQYRTARLIGDTLRVVNQDHSAFEIVKTKVSEDTTGWFQTETTSRKLNIKQTTQTTNGQTREVETVKNCRNVFIPKNVAPQTLTRIISIDLKQKKYEETLAYVQPETVYAGEKAIYLAQQGRTANSKSSGQETAIHKFSIAQDKGADYEATGIVNGQLINQFALDEHKGYLRIATNGTERTGQDWIGRGGSWNQVSRVLVLEQQGKKMKQVGQSEDMGKGERLYSVRFNDERAFVVTFRQVDPLYTLDLSNPRKPKVIGELKVPGFSTYIHMLGKNHLLTIGQDADEQTGRTRGLKLSIFDVKNFAKPREVKSLIFKSDVHSDASYEHKAFTFYDQKGILAIPASQNGSRSSLLLFQVNTWDIKAAGEISMTDLQNVRRSFFADNIVYAIGGTGVRAAAIENPSSPLATVDFNNQSVAGTAETAW